MAGYHRSLPREGTCGSLPWKAIMEGAHGCLLQEVTMEGTTESYCRRLSLFNANDLIYVHGPQDNCIHWVMRMLAYKPGCK